MYVLLDYLVIIVVSKLTVNRTDLSAMQHLILEGPMSPTQLAGRLRLSTAATTAVADRLTRLGHVRRAPHPTDRRGVVIEPAAESVATAMRALMPMIMGIDQVVREFSDDEQSAITRYLSRVVDVYRESLPPESGE